MDAPTIRAKHKEFVFAAAEPYYLEPLVLVEARGLKVRDLEGNSFLDFFGGHVTVLVGHSNERVNSAVVAQVGRLQHSSAAYHTLPNVDLAEKLASVAPNRLRKVYFSASGSEAVEMAVTLAQVHSGQMEIVAVRHGYAGRTLLAQALNGQAPWRPVPTQVVGVKHAVAPYCYRCAMKQQYPACGVACARDVEELIRTTTIGRVAAMVVEPVMGHAGFVVPPKEYFGIVAEIVRRHGGLIIADEAQSGLGRTGKWWGCQQFDLEPEIIAVSKGLANGFPLAATLAMPIVADSLKAVVSSTFGGNPVSCAAANAVLDEIRTLEFVENASRRGRELREGLSRLQYKHPKTVGEVRGVGLLQALELVTDETARDRTPNFRAAARLLEEAKTRGLLLGKGGLYGNVVRLAPPLNASKSEVEEALRILDEAMDAMGVG